MTKTSTSFESSVGVSTTSSWNDTSGSPCRSRRIAQAYIFAGTWPSGGISPTS